jgi:hypothetical protein
MINLETIQNEVLIGGKLLSLNIRAMEYEKTDKETNEKVKVEACSGSVKILVEENEESGSRSTQTVKVFINKLKKDGQINATYNTLDKLVGGIKTNEEIKEITKKNPSYKNEVIIYDKKDEEPTELYVSVWGKAPFNPHFSENRYVSNGELKSNIEITGGNLTIRDFDKEKDTLFTDFEIEGVIRKIEEEVDKTGQETGRLKVKVAVPFSNRGQLDVMELNLIAGVIKDEENEEDIDMAQAFRDEDVEAGMVMSFGGVIENTVKIEKIKSKPTFGIAKTTTKTEFKNEMTILRASYTQVEDEEEFLEDINALYKEKNIRNQEMIEKANEQREEEPPARNRSTGFGGNRARGVRPSWGEESSKRF